MKKIITALILCSSNMVSAQISMDLDNDITENIRTPVNSLAYDISSKDVVVETKYPVICNDLNSQNSPSDTSIKLIDPNGDEQVRVSLAGEPGSAIYQLGSKLFTAKTGDLGVISSSAKSDGSIDSQLLVIKNICLTYNKHEEIFNNSMEKNDSIVEEYTIKNFSSGNGSLVDVLKITLTIDKNLERPLNNVYLNRFQQFKYQIKIENLSNELINDLSIKEFLPKNNQNLAYLSDPTYCKINGTDCDSVLNDFSVSPGPNNAKIFNIERSPINLSRPNATFDNMQMMIGLFKKDFGQNGFIYFGSVDADFRVQYLN